jgi:hypothetical protein
MAKKEPTAYELARDAAVMAYSKIYKDSLAFDMAKIDKEKRLRLLEDPIYIEETKSIKANLYAKQIKMLNDVLDGQYSDPDKGSAGDIMKALEMRNKLLFNDLNIEADESNALNIVMTELSREDFEAMCTVEISITNANQSNEITFDVEE